MSVFINYDGLVFISEKNQVICVPGFVDKREEYFDENIYSCDDKRLYAYEGEGNSVGSLSSLASCTDDDELEFDHLTEFGPRFRKLADMFRQNSSDEENDSFSETDTATIPVRRNSMQHFKPE